MITLLVNLLVVGLLFWILYWVLGMLPIPALPKQVISVVLAVIFVIWLVEMLLGGTSIVGGLGTHTLLN